MQSYVALSIFSILSVIALVHVYWAFGGKKGVQLAIPKLEGSNAFTPGAGVTFLVAICLSLFAALSLGLIELVSIEPELLEYVQWAGIVVGTIFILRAIGDFNLVGFTKKNKQGDFAVLDSVLYSPLCLLLGSGYFYLVWGG